MFSSWKGDFPCCYDPLMQYFLSRCVAFILLSLLTHWGHTDEPSGSKIRLHTHTLTHSRGIKEKYSCHWLLQSPVLCWSQDRGATFLFSTVSYSGVKEAISFGCGLDSSWQAMNSTFFLHFSSCCWDIGFYQMWLYVSLLIAHTRPLPLNLPRNIGSYLFCSKSTRSQHMLYFVCSALCSVLNLGLSISTFKFNKLNDMLIC